MGHTLIAYVAAAVASASHAAAPPHGSTAALAARPLHGSVVLRAHPGGKAVLRVGPRGPLGGPLVLGVVGVRGSWVKVTAEALPNGHYAWAENGSFGPALGTRILVLTARQPRLPAGWNASITYYVAIHSGSGRGSAVSAGCLHATKADLRYLMRTVPLGAAIQVSS
jgi:hypothetical protein